MAEIRQNGLEANHIFFCDDNFTANRARTKELCERIIEEGLKLEWSAQVRVEAAKDPELLDLMAKSGCFAVFVGLESINPATLKAYNKSQTVEGIKDCVINFHHYGIAVHGMFVFGSEEDHYQVIRDTVKVSRQMDLDSLQYLILTPVPGTPFYKEMEAQNRIICRDWSQYDGHHTVFQPRQFTPYELQMETNRAMKKFYSWPSVLKRLVARDLFFAYIKAYAPHPVVENLLQEKPVLAATQGAALRPGPATAPMAARRQRGAPGGNSGGYLEPGYPGRRAPGNFCCDFLKRLGVEVVQETATVKCDTGPLAMVQGEIARLQEKADLVLLPLWQGLEGAAEKIKDLPQEFTQETMARLLALEFSRESFYNACMELGLCFQKRLKRIRRIYFQTLAEVGGQI